MKNLSLLLIGFLLLSCGANKPTISEEFHEQATKGNAYEYHYEKKPKTIMLMPVINDSGKSRLSNNILLDLIPRLQNKGYYVLPLKPSQDLIDEKGLSPQMIGADAILYIHIHEAGKTLNGETWVSVSYDLVEPDTNYVLWYQTKDIFVNSNVTSDSGDWLEFTLTSLITLGSTASISISNLIERINGFAVEDMPAGPYHPRYGVDDTDIIWVLRE